MAEDLSGRIFGRLTVVGPDRKQYWRCICTCGNTTVTRGRNLLSGDTQSCGCLHRERNKQPKNRADLIGQVFGNLRVVALDGVKSSETHWLCECLLCGGTKVVRVTALTKGATMSCGCLERQNREVVHDRLSPYLHDGTNIAKIQSDAPRADNTSGVKGVWYDKRGKKWVASLGLKGKKYRKSFDNFDDAVACRKQMEADIFAPVIAEFEMQKKEGDDC